VRAGTVDHGGRVNDPEEVTKMKTRAYRLMCSTTAVSALVPLLAAPKKWGSPWL
jgi:hypothetical protein